MYVSLDLIKRHLNIDSTFTEDDEYLTMLEGVAEKTIQRNICCVLKDMEDGEGKIPSPLCQAILLYVGLLYNSREAVAYGGNPVEVPYTFNYLLGLFKNYSDTTSDDFINSILDDLASATLLVDENGEVIKYGNEGSVIIDTELKSKAVDRVASQTEIDENGNYITGNIERI